MASFPERLEALSDRYSRFADLECQDYAPLYAALARGVASDPALLSFLADLPDCQPNLLFAAVQFVCGHDAMPRTVSAFSDFVQSQHDTVGMVMRARRTQTNEIGRCALLLPALPKGPLALLEVGASAGLCLLLDRFLYQYGNTETGITHSPVRIRCEQTGKGSIPVPQALPSVVWRRGLDLNPVNLGNPDDVRWLSSCVWLDHPERRQRLEAAIALAGGCGPEVFRGDLVDDLGVHLEGAPEEATLVVYHSAVLPYVAEDRRNQFFDALTAYSHRREVVLISLESPGVTPRLGKGEMVEDRTRFRLDRTVFSSGQYRTELLGLGHPHGRSLEWLQSLVGQH